MNISQHPFDDNEPRLGVIGPGLIYVVAALVLLGTLALSAEMRESVVAAPIASSATSIAGDLGSGSGYVAFEPPPAGPRSTFGFSHASTTKQAHESGKPADAQHSHIVARSQAFSFTGE